MSKCSSSSCGDGKASACGGADAVIARQDLAIESSLGRIRHKILVMSGKGGVGKSTVSTNLALSLANRGYRVGLMDVDLHGPDISRMLGLTQCISEVTEKEDGLVPPMRYNDNLKVISLEYMMENRDDTVIWRGPMKNQAIRQFIADINWGDLDYLIIDSPPGTGDEPMTVASTIKDAMALVVTTPQEISLADVRKSLNFCKHVNLQVLGVFENMSGFVCPHCHETVDLFKSGGGERMAADFAVAFLGAIPVDPMVVSGGDDGAPYLAAGGDSPAVAAFAAVVDNVEKQAASAPASPPMGEEACSACASSASCSGGSCPSSS